MKNGETLISPKDNKSEILILQGDGNLYGNRTNYNYGKMEKENNQNTEEEKKEDISKEENKSEEEK